MDNNKILEFIKSKGYDDVEFLFEWKGYEVYECIIDSEEPVIIGLPYKTLVKGNEIRLSNKEETFEILSLIDE